MSPIVFALALTAGPPVLLREDPAPGAVTRCELTLSVRGRLKVTAGDKPDELPLVATAAHTFDETTDRPGRVVRRYASATSTATVAGERTVRDLPADRRRVVAQAGPGGVTHYCPAGPLARDELELVSEHLSPATVAALLAGRPLAVGDTWTVPPEAVRAACHLDAVGGCVVTGTLTAGGPEPTFRFAGTADGVENGAAVKLEIKATGTFDTAVGRVTKLRWEQTDDRTQGPASPASTVTAVTEWNRRPVGGDATLVAGLPVGDVIPAELVPLRFADTKGRFRLTHPRDWYPVGRSADHLVLRLVDGGRFVAQATITPWKPAAAGEHTPAAEFRAALTKLPGWEPEAELAAGERPAGAGRWLYRVAVRGKQDGRPAVQTFYLLAGPTGRQVAVGVLAPAETAGTVGDRDERLVRGIELP